MQNHKYLRADVIIFDNSKEYFVDVKTQYQMLELIKAKTSKKIWLCYEQVFINKDFMKIYPDENSLLKQFTNNNNEIVIDNTNEQYQKYLTAPTEPKHITNSEKTRDEIRNKIEQIIYK